MRRAISSCGMGAGASKGSSSWVVPWLSRGLKKALERRDVDTAFNPECARALSDSVTCVSSSSPTAAEDASRRASRRASSESSLANESAARGRDSGDRRLLTVDSSSSSRAASSRTGCDAGERLDLACPHADQVEDSSCDASASTGCVKMVSCLTGA